MSKRARWEPDLKSFTWDGANRLLREQLTPLIDPLCDEGKRVLAIADRMSGYDTTSEDFDARDSLTALLRDALDQELDLRIRWERAEGLLNAESESATEDELTGDAAWAFMELIRVRNERDRLEKFIDAAVRRSRGSRTGENLRRQAHARERSVQVVEKAIEIGAARIRCGRRIVVSEVRTEVARALDIRTKDGRLALDTVRGDLAKSDWRKKAKARASAPPNVSRHR